MAWVNRTTRDNNRVGASSSSTKNIGPGSYYHSSSLGMPKPAYAPFGSTDLRRNPTGLVTPGPGSYTHFKPPQRAVHGDTAFKSKTERGMAGATFATPGPGAYSAPPSFQHSPGKALKRYRQIQTPCLIK